MALGRKGGVAAVWAGKAGEGEKPGDVVSRFKTEVREATVSQPGGMMLARR